MFTPLKYHGRGAISFGFGVRSDWAPGLMFVGWWLAIAVLLWNWGPEDAKSALASVFCTACLLGLVGQPRREGLSDRLEEMGRARLIEGLIALSLPADEQLACLPAETDAGGTLIALVLGPFRLIRDHSAKPVGELLDILEEIEALVERQPEEFRLEESVLQSEQWGQLRSLAKRALGRAGVDRRVPDLDFLREAGK